MRLNIRGRLAPIAALLSLIPIVLTGVLAYRSARGALEERIRFNLETQAAQTLEMLDRLILERQQNVQGWGRLGFIQDDTVTGDADGRITQFLQEAKRAGGSLEDILQMVDRTTQALRQITLATQQQRSASEQIVQTMREVAEITKQSAAGMKQSAASVAELTQLADQLKVKSQVRESSV